MYAKRGVPGYVTLERTWSILCCEENGAQGAGAGQDVGFQKKRTLLSRLFSEVDCGPAFLASSLLVPACFP